MTPHASRFEGGFSLIEVLVSMLLVAIGLLGVSKMQAAGISNSQIARERSLVSLQASSLAAAMHGNAKFWSEAGVLSVSLKGSGNIAGSSATAFSSTKACTTFCTESEFAADDLRGWMGAMALHFPNYAASIGCDGTVPQRCVIRIDWAEKYVAVNATTASAAGAAQQSRQGFSLVVQP
ncbi:Type IV pilus modification protein PilV [Burkholderiales bacterium 8X]|nr:Type IV pilus modification protein PilV [Burkholderiales bacterium 8X]